MLCGCGKHYYSNNSYTHENYHFKEGDNRSYIVITPTHNKVRGLFRWEDTYGEPYILDLIVKSIAQHEEPVRILSIKVVQDDVVIITEKALSANYHTNLKYNQYNKYWEARISYPLKERLKFKKSSKLKIVVNVSLPYNESETTLEQIFTAESKEGSGYIIDTINFST